MSMNRIQFQKGISLNQFLDKYGTEKQCETTLEASRWPDGFSYSDCASPEHLRYRKGTVLVFQCRSYHKHDRQPSNINLSQVDNQVVLIR